MCIVVIVLHGFVLGVLLTTSKRKPVRSSDHSKRKYTWRYPEVKNKGKIRARKQKVVGAEALMDLRVASEDQDKTSSTARTASKKNDSDEEDDVNSLFDETSDVENGNGNGCKIAEEEDMTNGEMIDVDSEAGLLISEDDSRRTSVRGSTEDAQPTTTHETHEVSLLFIPIQPFSPDTKCLGWFSTSSMI